VLFHTLDFLVFLPLTVAIYWLVPRRARLWVLCLSSLFFYGAWSLAYLPVLLGVIALSWLGGLWLSSRRDARAGQPDLPARVLVLGLLLGPLLFFKYWDWLAWNAEALATFLGHPELALPRVDLPLPVGISFFTFQALAYVIDTARHDAHGGKPAERDLLRFSTFVAFFPQLVAGPIVRRHELLPQLHDLPLLRDGQVGAGLFRIARGMAKKVLIADIVRVGMVDPVFSDPGRFTGPEILLALYAYTLQIYYDFSAYTDIAIGAGRLFGLELPENFRRPYKATCVAGFWRRWHITLSNWVRDYVYYPLGGSRVDGGQWKVYRNIMATLIIIGIWHGAAWNFVVYGTLHGAAVAWCRYRRKVTGRRPDDPLPGAWAFAWRWLATFHFVVLARILFRADDLSSAWELFTDLLDPTFVMPRYSLLAWTVFLLGFAIHFSPDRWSQRAETWFSRQNPLLQAGIAAAVGVACMTLGGGEQLAFIYYQF